MSTDVRARVCRAMWQEMNLWGDCFAPAVTAVAQGLLDGTLTEKLITAYPVGTSPVNLSRAIATTVGLRYYADTGPVYEDGWRVDVDAQEIDSAAELLLAIGKGDVGLHDAEDVRPWSFWPHTLDEGELTLDQVRDFMRGLSLRDSAQLVVDAANCHR